MPDAPEAPVVTLAQARAHVLRKQGLAGGGLGSVLEAVRATGGVYGTAPTCYLSIAARVPSFVIADLDAELYERRALVRSRGVRGMAYIEPIELLPALFACTGEARDRTLTRVSKWSEMAEEETLAFADRIEAVLAGEPSLTVPEIRKRLDGPLPGNRNALQMTVALLGRYGRIVRAQARGSWRSNLYPYARWADWLGAPVEELEPEAGRVEVARRYLEAYGPATTADLAWWTGWTKRDSTAALTALGDEVVSVSIEAVEGGKAPAAWVLASEFEALATIGVESGRSVRLLPIWDAYFMGYEGTSTARARQLAAQDYPRVYDKVGNGTSVVIEDGVAAGVWELSADAGLVTVAPFGDLRWQDVEAQVASLSRTIGAPLRLERADPPGPLSDGPRNAFMSPISLRPPAIEAED